MKPIRERVKKNLKVTDRSVNGEGGGVKPQSATNISFFFQEKNMKNVLKRNNVILMKKFAKYVYLDLFYFLY